MKIKPSDLRQEAERMLREHTMPPLETVLEAVADARERCSREIKASRKKRKNRSEMKGAAMKLLVVLLLILSCSASKAQQTRRVMVTADKPDADRVASALKAKLGGTLRYKLTEKITADLLIVTPDPVHRPDPGGAHHRHPPDTTPLSLQATAMDLQWVWDRDTQQC